MNERYRRGLVVGKFAPLHRGHELVIRTALERCDEVVLLSYSKPELPGCEPERRRAWLAALFPECTSLVLSDREITLPANDDADSVHRRFVGRLCRDVLRKDVDAVFTSEAYGEGFARELAGFLARPVAHVVVDPQRRAEPVSGAAIRADVHAHRRWLSPAVYASFVARVAVLGGESSGKTSLCQALARELETTWVAEYGRELWVERGGELEIGDLLGIAREQVRREEQAQRAALRFLFCDTSPLTTWFYSRELFGVADPELEALASRAYDLTVVCAPDIPFVQDGTRRDAAFRERQHRFYQAELSRRGLSFVLAEGSMQARVASVVAALF